jgi:hypothetical protein
MWESESFVKSGIKPQRLERLDKTRSSALQRRLNFVVREVYIAAINRIEWTEFTGAISLTGYKKIFCPVSWRGNDAARVVKTFHFRYLTLLRASSPVFT